ncbi:hypothetical protein BCV70DRAFT_91658 [Testicularia cyperi]|uniref:Uncharacterized protein n=1 Tax=Testicularia cyperi TaxID=1882483 RepID=A0A317XTN5_9BASI|nr:hypothetical protein BCV70DRAFT_91658 [Testicularia cyperi]
MEARHETAKCAVAGKRQYFIRGKRIGSRISHSMKVGRGNIESCGHIIIVAAGAITYCALAFRDVQLSLRRLPHPVPDEITGLWCCCIKSKCSSLASLHRCISYVSPTQALLSPSASCLSLASNIGSI